MHSSPQVNPQNQMCKKNDVKDSVMGKSNVRVCMAKYYSLRSWRDENLGSKEAEQKPDSCSYLLGSPLLSPQ